MPKICQGQPPHLAHTFPDFIQIGSLSPELLPNAWRPFLPRRVFTIWALGAYNYQWNPITKYEPFHCCVSPASQHADRWTALDRVACDVYTCRCLRLIWKRLGMDINSLRSSWTTAWSQQTQVHDQGRLFPRQKRLHLLQVTLSVLAS